MNLVASLLLKPVPVAAVKVPDTPAMAKLVLAWTKIVPGLGPLTITVAWPLASVLTGLVPVMLAPMVLLSRLKVTGSPTGAFVQLVPSVLICTVAVNGSAWLMTSAWVGGVS